jgi:hypothetical protein
MYVTILRLAARTSKHGMFCYRLKYNTSTDMADRNKPKDQRS